MSIQMRRVKNWRKESQGKSCQESACGGLEGFVLRSLQHLFLSGLFSGFLSVGENNFLPEHWFEKNQPEKLQKTKAFSGDCSSCSQAIGPILFA